MSDEDTTGQSNDDVIPEHFRQELSEARAEAAKYRTEKNDAVEKAKADLAAEYNEKIQEYEAQVAKIQEERGEALTYAERLKVTIQAGIDSDKALSFADLLKGETEEELLSHAEELKKLFVSEESPKNVKVTDPSQGNTGNPLPLNGDPLLNAVTSIVNGRKYF